MSMHKLVNMKSDWDAGSSKYNTRLELGNTAGAITDLRFMAPGWVENIHALWFGENGSESTYSGSDGAMITAYKSAGNVTDMVFFDPQNTGGKTLSDLVSGAAGLWETSGTRTSLIASQPIDLADELNMAGQIIDNASQLHANTASGIGVYDSTGVWRGTMCTSTYAFQCANSGIDMNNRHIDGVNDIKGTQAVTTTLDFYGSNAAGSALINFMGWDSATETLKVNKPLALGANKITGLGAATVNGDALRYEQLIGAYLLLSGGTMAGDIAMGGNDITGVDDIMLTNSNSYIDFNAGYITDIDLIGAYDTGGIRISGHEGATTIDLVTSSYAIDCNNDARMNGNTLEMTGGNIEMSSGDITQCKNISGLTTGTDGANRLGLDFRGDTNHRIYYTGISDNRLGYKTHTAHAFAIQSATILQIKSTGLEIAGSINFDGNVGKIKIEENDTTGDMEFCVQTGDSFVFKTVA